MTICERCGKNHPPVWHHPGDCTQCHQRPVIRDQGKKRDSIFCQECFDALQTKQPEADTSHWLARFSE